MERDREQSNAEIFPLVWDIDRDQDPLFLIVLVPFPALVPFSVPYSVTKPLVGTYVHGIWAHSSVPRSCAVWINHKTGIMTHWFLLCQYRSLYRPRSWSRAVWLNHKTGIRTHWFLLSQSHSPYTRSRAVWLYHKTWQYTWKYVDLLLSGFIRRTCYWELGGSSLESCRNGVWAMSGHQIPHCDWTGKERHSWFPEIYVLCLIKSIKQPTSWYYARQTRCYDDINFCGHGFVQVW